MISTAKVKESQAFYERMGFATVFDSGWYVHMAWPNATHVQIGFIEPGHETQPAVFQPAYEGQGIFMGLEVKNLDSTVQHLKNIGLSAEFGPHREEWGQYHAAYTDPNGVVLDFIENTEVSADYQDDFAATQ